MPILKCGKIVIIAEMFLKHNSEFNSISHIQLFLQQKSHPLDMLINDRVGYKLILHP